MKNGYGNALDGEPAPSEVPPNLALEKARGHLHEALDGTLYGDCKNEIVLHIELALEFIGVYEQAQSSKK